MAPSTPNISALTITRPEIPVNGPGGHQEMVTWPIWCYLCVTFVLLVSNTDGLPLRAPLCDSLHLRRHAVLVRESDSGCSQRFYSRYPRY
jgi:hypothetical protein